MWPSIGDRLLLTRTRVIAIGIRKVGVFRRLHHIRARARHRQHPPAAIVGVLPIIRRRRAVYITQFRTLRQESGRTVRVGDRQRVARHVDRRQLRDLRQILARVADRIVRIARRAGCSGRIEVFDCTRRPGIAVATGVATVNVRRGVLRRTIDAVIADRGRSLGAIVGIPPRLIASAATFWAADARYLIGIDIVCERRRPTQPVGHDGRVCAVTWIHERTETPRVRTWKGSHAITSRLRDDLTTGKGILFFKITERINDGNEAVWIA